MKAADALKLLVYDQEMSIPLVARKLGLHKDTVLKWLWGREPRCHADKQALLQLLEVDPEDADDRLEQIDTILEVARALDNADQWKRLFIGLQRRLAFTQTELLMEAGLGDNAASASGWMSLKSFPTLQSRYKVLKLVQERGLDIEELMRLGGCVKVGRLYRAIEEGRPLWALDRKLVAHVKGRWVVNPLAVLPEDRNGRELMAFDDDKFWIVCYMEKASSQPTPLRVPKFIVLSPNFLIGLGIYVTEGARGRHPKITNSEPNVIRLGIKFFGSLGIPRSAQRAWIQLHERAGTPQIEVRRFWLANARLHEQQIRGPRIKASSGNAEVEKFGVLHIEVPSILARLLIEGMMCKLPRLLRFVPRTDLRFFLQGAFAGDGYVGLTRKGTVQEVNFTSKDPVTFNLVAKLLSLSGVRYHKDHGKYQIRVFGYENFLRLRQLDIFSCHMARRARFETGLAVMGQKLPRAV